MTDLKQLSDTKIDELVARARGWVNFPTDSLELGDTWYFDAKTAPFCDKMYVDEYTPTKDWEQCAELIDLILNDDSNYIETIALHRGKNHLRCICEAFIKLKERVDG